MVYNFEIKTGDIMYAGTDSNIFLTLYGETGQLNEQRLNGYISGNAFERNDTNRFSINYGDADVGRIYKITMHSDCKYGGSDWYASYVKITRGGNDKNDESNLPSTFQINAWINDTGNKDYTLQQTDWQKNIAKYETVVTPYKSYKISVPSNSTYKYSHTEETTTGFSYTNAETKKTTQQFNQEITGKGSYSSAAKLTEQLSVTKAFEGFLKFGFSQGFEDTKFSQFVKTENQKISTTVEQTLDNKSPQTKTYEAQFNMVKVNAISKLNSIIASFSANSEIVFAGFIEVT